MVESTTSSTELFVKKSIGFATLLAVVIVALVLYQMPSWRNYAEAKPAAVQADSTVCLNRAYGNGVYYFECTGERFAEELSRFLNKDPLREAPLEYVVSFAEVGRGRGTIVLTDMSEGK